MPLASNLSNPFKLCASGCNPRHRNTYICEKPNLCQTLSAKMDSALRYNHPPMYSVRGWTKFVRRSRGGRTEFWLPEAMLHVIRRFQQQIAVTRISSRSFALVNISETNCFPANKSRGLFGVHASSWWLYKHWIWWNLRITFSCIYAS